MPISMNDKGEAAYLTDDGKWEPSRIVENPETKERLAWNGKDWQALKAPAKSKGVMDYADDVVRSIASGVTFGWADELAAKADEVTGRGGTYEENLKREKTRDEEIPAAIKIPGEIAGAVAGTVATLPVTGPLAAATKLPQYARYIAGGAAGGALSGAGNADPGERIEGAKTGAALGTAAGVAAPLLVRGVGATVNAARNAITPQANVSADLARAITRDGMTPQQLEQRALDAAQTRPGVATVADAGGENVRGLVERVAQTPGAGRASIVPALEGRQRGQMVRISNDLTGLTGTRQTAHQAIEETMEQRATAARPLYDAAMNFNAREVPEIAQAFGNEVSTGWGQAVLRSPAFKRTLETEYGIKDAAQAPLMVLIDSWKKGVDDLIEEATRKGSGNQARVLQGMRGRVLDVVDQHNPAYAQARGAWAGPSRYLDAIEEGRNIFNTKVSAEELASGITNMGQAEQEAFRIGAISAIRGKMGNDAADLKDVTKYLRSPEMRSKVAAIMPTPEARQAWQQRLDFEVGSSKLTGKALGNSATARRLAEKADADSIVGDLVMEAFAGAPPISLLRRAVGAVPRKIRDTLRSRSDHVLAELLTDPQGMQSLRAAIERIEGQAGPRSAIPGHAATQGANAYLTENQR